MVLRTLLQCLVWNGGIKGTCRTFLFKPKSWCTCKINNSSAYYTRTNTIMNFASRKNVSLGYKNSTGEVSKLNLLAELNFQSHEDAMPFLKLPLRTLLHIHKVTKKDQANGYCKNRLYYIAKHIQVSPAELSERLAQRTFIYGLSFDWLEKSLAVLIEYGVTGDRILRDLWVLKYHHETIRERLQRVKDSGIDTLYPWMVRCSEDILNRFIKITQDTKKILGDSMSTHIYLANRLCTTSETVEEMCNKIPALKTIRVTKVKKFLDFLIKEGFDVEDISNKPRVLTASQKTVEQRLIKLRKLGLKEINLNVLCKSRKDFKKYADLIESITNLHIKQN